MSEINVKIRSGAQTLYDTKVFIEFEETVRVLKKKICEKDESLHENLLEIVYCGSVMEDNNSINAYDVFNGVMVHAFKQNKYEKPGPNKPLSETELVRLGVAFRSLSVNSTFKGTLNKLSGVLNNIILTTPGLNEDPVAITLLQHCELLAKFTDFDAIKRIAESHPALAAAALQMAATVQEEVMMNHLTSDGYPRHMINLGSDDDVEDIDDSSPASEASSHPVSRNSSFGTFRGAITAAQLASAIASVTTQQPQPSTSGASTSTGITANDLGSVLASLQNQQIPPENELSTQLQIMREMGLTNEALNLEALRVSSDLESAIELVLSGFSISDDRSNTQN